jgi:uncharacterized membrane protein YqjE
VASDPNAPTTNPGAGLLSAGLRQFTGLMIEALQARIQLAEHDWRELRAQLLRRGLILAMALLCVGFSAIALQAWVILHWWEQAGPAALLVVAAIWGVAALCAVLLLVLDLKASGWAVVQRR